MLGSAKKEVDHGEFIDFGISVFVVSLVVGIFVRTVGGTKPKSGRLKNILGLLQALPYTVWLMLFGVMLGVLNLYDPNITMGSSVEAWQHVDAHVLLFVFLPVLLFESSFSTDVHIMRHESLQIFCLAIPGVLISTSLTALFAKAVYPTFSWNVAFLFGAMLSATDPVAVVALLKDLGVDDRLGTLIEGESLMNDGSAIVMYTIFSKAIMNPNFCCDVGQVFLWTFRLSFGGPLLGLGIGFFVVYILEFVRNDMISEVTLTVAAAYSCFLIAEGTACKVSGVLAVVFCGLYLSEKAIFSVKTEKSLHSFWAILEYIADTLVFIVSGLIVALVVWEGDISASDWGYLFILYVVLHVNRFLIVVLCWPVLKSKRGYGKLWDYKELLVLVFSGLRGTVGLALALIAEDFLSERHRRDDAKNSSLVLFNMAGIAFLTLVINGSLMAPLIHYLQLDHVSRAEEDLFHHSCAIVEAKLQTYVDDVLKRDLFLGDAQYQLVWRYVPVLSPAQYWHRIEAGKIILAPDEREDALKNVRRLRPRSRLLCPPELEGTWDRYHREFGSIPRSACGHCLDEGVLRTQRSITSACNTPIGKFEDPTLVLSKLTEQLRKTQLSAALSSNKQLLPSQVLRRSSSMMSADELPDTDEGKEFSSVWNKVFSRGDDEKKNKQKNDSKVPGVGDDALRKGRTRFMTGVRAKYLANQHVGRMLPRTLRYLREAADIQLDYPENPLHDWEYLEDRLNSPSLQFYLMVLQRLRTTRLPVINWAITHFCRTQVFNQLALTQEVATEFIYARGEIDLNELLNDDGVARLIAKESDHQVNRVLHYMHRNMEWPEISNALKTRTASRQLLMYHTRIVDELLEDGAVSERELELFTEMTEQMLRKIHKHPVSEEARSMESILIEGVPGPRNIQTKLSLMKGIQPDEIRGFLTEQEPHAVMFREVFVRPHVRLFEKGETQVHGADDQSIRGRSGWFVLVRGMVHREGDDDEEEGGSLIDGDRVPGTEEDAWSIDSSASWQEGRGRVLMEPGSMIGLVDQLLGQPMSASFTTSSYCHLIFMDSVAYLKEASPHTNAQLFTSLFTTMASEVLPTLLDCLFANLPLDKCSFLTVDVETVCSSNGLGVPVVESGMKHSDSFYDLTEIAAQRRERASFSVFNQKKQRAAAAAAAAAAEESTSSDSCPVHRQHVVKLKPDKWYALLRGSVLGGCAMTANAQRLHLLGESIRTLAGAVGADEEAAAQKKSDLQQLNNVLCSLMKYNGSPGLIEQRDAPTLLRGLDGRVRVSARAVILELPDVFRAARAASKWLFLTRRRQRELELDRLDRMDRLPDRLESPRSSRRFFQGIPQADRRVQLPTVMREETKSPAAEWDTGYCPEERVTEGIVWDASSSDGDEE